MRALLRNTGLVAYLLGNLASVTGTWAQRVLIFWMAWNLTGSPSVLGLLAALDLLPSVLVAPLAGAFADSRPAVRLTRDVQLLSAVPCLAMIGAVQWDWVTLPVLMALSLTTGILNGLDHPLRLLLVGLVAPRDHLSIAVAANSIVFNIGRMIGPAIGGWAVSAGAHQLVFGYNGLTFVLFAVILSRMSVSAVASGSERTGRMLDGLFRWGDVWRAFDRALIVAFVQFTVIASLIRPVFELLPAFARDLTAAGLDAAKVFSLLTSAQGLGAMIGAFAVSVLMARFRFRGIAMAAGLLAVLAELLFLGTTTFLVAVFALAALSGTVLANGIATQVAIQTRLSPLVRGRALSLYTITFRGMPAAGALLVGALAEIVPLRLVLVALAVLTLCLFAWTAAVARRSE